MNPLSGIFLKILSVTLFVAMATCIKSVADHVPAGEAVFFRSFFAIPVILIWLASKGELKHGLTTANPMGHLWRGLVGTSAMGLGFTALGLLPLPEVTAIGYAAPVLTVIFAAMFLGEKIRLFRLSAIVLGLIGVVVIVSPRLTVLSDETADQMQTIGALLMLVGAVFSALAQVFVRKLVNTERTAPIVFYFSITASLLSLLTFYFGWVLPTPQEAILLVLAGILGGLGQILLTTSYRFAETSVIAPFEYTSMLLALIIGYSVFDEVPTMTTIMGAGLVIAAGLIIIYREQQLGLERARQRKVMTPHG